MLVALVDEVLQVGLEGGQRDTLLAVDAHLQLHAVGLVHVKELLAQHGVHGLLALVRHARKGEVAEEHVLGDEALAVLVDPQDRLQRGCDLDRGAVGRAIQNRSVPGGGAGRGGHDGAGVARHADAVAVAAVGAGCANLGGVDLGELLHHVHVVGVAAGADDDGLGVELDDLALAVDGKHTGDGARLVGDQLLGRGLEADVQAELLGAGDEAHHELRAQALGALACIEVPGGVGLAEGNDLLEAHALLLEPVNGLGGLVEESAVQLGVGHVVVVGHQAADDLLDVDLDASLLLPVGTHGEHALGTGEGAAREALLLEHDHVEAVLERLDTGGQAGAARADDHQVVGLDHVGRTNLFDDVGVVDDRGLLALGGGVDVVGARVARGGRGLVGDGGGSAGDGRGDGGGSRGLDKVPASELHGESPIKR